MTGHIDEVRCCVLYATYKLISSGGDKSIKIWDLTTSECKLTLYGHTNKVTCLKLVENETLLVSASFDKSIKGWDIVKGVCLFTLNGHSDIIMCLDQLNNNNLIR